MVQLRDLAEVAVDADEAVQVDLVQQLHDASRRFRALLALCSLQRHTDDDIGYGCMYSAAVVPMTLMDADVGTAAAHHDDRCSICCAI